MVQRHVSQLDMATISRTHFFNEKSVESFQNNENLLVELALALGVQRVRRCVYVLLVEYRLCVQHVRLVHEL